MNVELKLCSKCKFEKEISCFGVDNIRKSGLKPYCKECRKNESDKDKEKARKKNWYQNNRILTLERSKNRQIEKRVERNLYLNDYYKRKPYIYTWRSLVYRTLKGKMKDDTTLELLGYNYVDLKEHLESLFTEGMSWENYGEWHVDHIKPIANFTSNTLPSIVSALSNLQPLWATTREINGIIYEGNLNKNKNEKTN